MTELSVVKTDADLARLALGTALDIRKKANIPLNMPLSIYDLCTSMGIEVRFVNISMEGNYIPGKHPVFLISALRPAARRAFTCAHELGHHVFGHGFKLDELIETRPSTEKTPEEFLADCFASFLLMPALGIRKAFAQRNWKFAEVTPEQVYTIACDFGVGYGTLVTHLSVGLKLISYSQSQALKKVKLSSIKESFVGDIDIDRRLIVVDSQWLSPVVECEVGDHILVDGSVSAQNDSLQMLSPVSGKLLFKAARRGVTALKDMDGTTSKQVRIMAHQFIGLNRYLYLPDPEEDEP